MFGKRIAGMALLMVLTAFILAPFAGHTQEAEAKVVRVGWYESSYNTMDEKGFRSGYAYEYQLKLAAYNGWTYEYVNGSWPELLKMLENGEIDLLSDVSYTAQREEHMLFSSLPMGTEEYYLFKLPGNDEISMTDVSTLDGKRVGVNRGSVQAGLFAQWTQDNGVEAEVVEVTGTDADSLRMLQSGELDAYVVVDSFAHTVSAVPVYKIGSSDYYFAVAKDRPDLLSDLDLAMSRIQDENHFFNMQMYEKYMRQVGANAYLTTEEKDWLSGHGAIRIGYQDEYMAFCDADDDTGELTGVLKDYLGFASDCLPEVQLQFEAIAYPTAEEAVTALQNGEVDCAFPANLSSYEAEIQGMVLTPPLMDTEMFAVMRAGSASLLARDGEIVAAVNMGNFNYDSFLARHYPSWEKKYYPNTEECLKGVSEGAADCLIISNYRYNNIARLCEKYRLTTVSLGTEMDYCFAVRKGQTSLYAIMAKVTSMVPEASVDAAMSRYITQDAKLTIADYLTAHLPLVLTIVFVVVLIILILLIQNIQAARRANRLIMATETDDLTGLYNRKYFFQYANRRYRMHPDAPMDAIVLNIEQFHSINALHGRTLGDRVLRELGNEVRAISRENSGIAGRFEADRFDIYCRHTEDYQAIFNRLQAKLDEQVPNTNVRLRMGIMPYQAGLEPVQLFDRARTACNMARGHYRRHLIVYDENVSKRESYEQRLINDLRRAFEAHEFEVYYQPKFDIQAEPPRMVSAEALVRWHHPEMGMIPPGDFIPLFEKNGQISLVDQYVWREAARQIAAWREAYGVTVPVSVNLSRVDVFDPALVDTLEDILKSNGLTHDVFKLEVTESAYTENADQVIRVVEGLREKGYKIEMDDFGTGYSSLNMLSSMPIDYLKMDREFVRNIDHEERDRQLVALILDIAKNLKVPVIAEGVERDSQLELLKGLLCEQVQGYYFSRPVPADKFGDRFLKESALG